MASVTREQIGHLHDKLVVQVEKDDYLPAFEKSIKKYSKQANIPGFRKGMVPAGMIKKMYGGAVFQEEVLRSVENELRQYLEKEKPEIFTQPLPYDKDAKMDLDLNQPGEYEFPFEIGLKPEVSLDALSKGKFTKYNIAVSEETVNEKVEELITQKGALNDIEAISSSENVININFNECDAEGKLVDDGITNQNSLLIKYFLEDTQKALQGKKVGDAIHFQLNKAFGEKELSWVKEDLGLNEDESAGERYFQMSIDKIAEVEKKELNEEFFKSIFPSKDIQTEAQFREAIKEDFQAQWEQAAKNQLHDQIYHTLIDTPIDLPEGFLKRWLEVGGEKQKTDTEVEADYPNFKNSLIWQLMVDKIADEQKIEIQPEEVKEAMKKELSKYFGGGSVEEQPWLESYLERMMADKKKLESTYNSVYVSKIFDWLDSQVTPQTKSISPEEFNKMMENHHH